MPISHAGQLTTIVQLMQTTYAESLLDIGVGFGTWGFLFREYLEIDPDRNIYGRNSWRRRVDGIEIFPNYLLGHHAHLYDKIFIGDALQIVPALTGGYDLAMVVDVLEHFTYRDGCELMRAVLARSRGVIVSVPKNNYTQGAEFGNVHETHRHEWKPRELRQFGPCYFVANERSIIAFIGPDALKMRLRRYPKLLTWGHRVRHALRRPRV